MKTFVERMRLNRLSGSERLIVGFCAALAVAIGIVWLLPEPSAETKANIWVAVGTLALAIVTWWSLAQTRSVIAAEDRRHQQGFAPLLTISPNSRIHGVVSMTVQNVGQGIAQRVLVQIAGDFLNTEGIPAVPVPPESQAHHISVVARGGEAGLQFPLPSTDLPFARLTRIRIEYADMFGNEYVTEYRAFSENPNDMRWQQPDKLKIPETRR